MIFHKINRQRYEMTYEQSTPQTYESFGSHLICITVLNQIVYFCAHCLQLRYTTVFVTELDFLYIIGLSQQLPFHMPTALLALYHVFF